MSIRPLTGNDHEAGHRPTESDRPGVVPRGRSRVDFVWASVADRFALVADRGWLAAVLALFLAKQLLLVVLIGPFSGHDEVDHYWYVERLADGHGLGEVGVVELPPEAMPFDRFVADYPLNSEVIQPPLYHAVLAVLSDLLPGDTQDTLYLLRITSVLIGLVVVWLSYLISRTIFPADPWVRVGVPVFVALQPQFSFEAAIVNHDILVIALVTLACLMSVRVVRDGLTWQQGLGLGIVSAAGLWTKVTFGLILPVIALAILFALWPLIRRCLFRRRGAFGDLLRVGAFPTFLALVLPLVAALPWFIRNLSLYGDPTGASRLEEVSDYALSASTLPEMLSSPVFWRGRLDDFWGNYGWREIPWDTPVAVAVYLIWAVAGLGVMALVIREGVAVVSSRVRPAFDGFQRRCLALIGLAVLMMIVGVLYVGTIQFTQSRFAFPAMAGFGLMTVLGYGAWVPARWRWVIPIAMTVGLVVLNFVVLIRFVIPYYVGPGGGELVIPGP